MPSGNVLNMVIHGLVRVTRIVGQVYPTGTVSAPILIGAKGGIVVEGVDNNLPISTVTTNDINVALASIQIMAANPNRNANVFQNNGVNPVFLGFDTPAVINQGITLLPNVAWESNSVFQGAVFAIAAAGINRVTVLQG